MKTKLSNNIISIAVIFAAAAAQAQSTAFTYQGRLNDSGTGANGIYDLRFQIFDAATGGSAVGIQLSTNGLPVTNGLFLATLDFGAGIFAGSPRWLEVQARTNIAVSFITLSPRQALTAVPYALFATNAGNAATAGGVANGSVTAAGIASGQVVKSLNGLKDNVTLAAGANVSLTTNGNTLQMSAPGLTLPFSGTASNTGSIFTVTNLGAGPAGVFFGTMGIGNISPSSLLSIGSSSLRGTLDINTGVAGGFGPRATLNDQRPGGHEYSIYSGLTSAGSFDIYDDSTARTYLTVSSVGNVGIGTTAPQAPLHVVAGNGNYGQLGTAQSGVFGYSPSGIGVYAYSVGTGYPFRADGPTPQATLLGGATAGISLAGGTTLTTTWDITATFDATPTLTVSYLGTSELFLGDARFAAGHRAKANFSGDFVWADNSIDADFTPGTANSFSARAAGGVNFYSSANLGSGVFLPAGGNSWAAVSDRSAKENFHEVAPREILAKVVALPVLNYNMKTQDPAIRHLGPMAQDFYAAFQLGEDNKHITTVDADGVALAAIQGLNQKLEAKDAKIAELENRLEKLERLLIERNGGAR